MKVATFASVSGRYKMWNGRPSQELTADHIRAEMAEVLWTMGDIQAVAHDRMHEKAQQ